MSTEWHEPDVSVIHLLDGQTVEAEVNGLDLDGTSGFMMVGGREVEVWRIDGTNEWREAEPVLLRQAGPHLMHWSRVMATLEKQAAEQDPPFLGYGIVTNGRWAITSFETDEWPWYDHYRLSGPGARIASNVSADRVDGILLTHWEDPLQLGWTGQLVRTEDEEEH